MVLHHFDTDGGSLAVEVLGSGPLVVCSPGMGDFRDAYAPLAAHLTAQNYTVALMDARGHGDSSAHFNNYGDEATASDFLLVIRKLGFTKAVLAGDSFGAGAAAIAAAKEPDLVAGLVLLGPYLRNPPGLMGAIGLKILPFLFWKPWGPAMWRYYAATLWPGLGADGAKARAAKSTESLTRPNRWLAFQKTVAGLDHSVIAPYIKDQRVKAPALVVMGNKDPDWSDPVKEAEWVATNFAEREVVVVDGAGHAPMLERPERVNDAVLGFLGKVRGKGGYE